jgi:Ni/Fe-hydrogenase 1 B-type cytochrome subunit
MNRNEFPVVLGFYLPSVHEFLASIILGFTVLHLVTVVLHDFKGTASDISAMINGYKVFVIQKQESSAVHTVSLDQLKKNR